MKSIGMKSTRGHGIVWVCDVAGSSKRLNTAAGVNETEAFIQRLFWTTRGLAPAFGARFFKWTGDGFVAWFPFNLERERSEVVSRAVEAALHLSHLVDATQLALQPTSPFRIRHGMACERDALVLEIQGDDGTQEYDLVGRDVVLAFRLSGIPKEFPYICAHRDVAEFSIPEVTFRPRVLGPDDLSLWMKGESYGTTAVFETEDDRPLGLSQEQIAHVKANVQQAEVKLATGATPDWTDPHNKWSLYMKNPSAPDWSHAIMAKLDEDVRKRIKTILDTQIPKSDE